MSKPNRNAKKYAQAQARHIINGERQPIAYDDLLREYFAVNPQDAHGQDALQTGYYKKFLFRKVLSIFKFTMPDTWDYDYVTTTLFLDGKLAIANTPYGVLGLRTGTAGINVFERPTQCIISNPLFPTLTRTIGEDCVLVKIQYDYSGIDDMLRRYSYFMAQCDASLSSNLYNSRVAFIGYAENDAQAATLYKMYDAIAAGKPCVVVGNQTVKPSDYTILNVKNSYVGIEILTTYRIILNQFLTEMGIKNANTEKRERLITAEIESSMSDAGFSVWHFYANIKRGFDAANAMFPELNLNVEINDEALNLLRTETDAAGIDDRVGGEGNGNNDIK